jgi:hypothetical protein
MSEWQEGLHVRYRDHGNCPSITINPKRCSLWAGIDDRTWSFFDQWSSRPIQPAKSLQPLLVSESVKVRTPQKCSAIFDPPLVNNAKKSTRGGVGLGESTRQKLGPPPSYLRVVAKPSFRHVLWAFDTNVRLCQII